MSGSQVTVAVTGASGFLGSHVCRASIERGHWIVGIVHTGSGRKLPADLPEHVDVRDADVLDRASLNAALRGTDVVVHCAALVSVDHAEREKTTAVNVTGTRNVLQACIDNGIRRLVHVSSVHAYRQLRGAELNRNSLLATDVRLPYPATKAAAHVEVLRALSDRAIGGSIVCPGGLIGPGDDRPTIVGRMVLDIACKKIPLMVNEGFWWSDVRDTANAIVEAASPAADGGVFFTAGRYAKVGQLAEICSRVLGYSVTRPAVPYAAAVVGLPFVRAYTALRRLSPLYTRSTLLLLRDCPASVDHQSSKHTLGYEARPLDESIRDALNWFREHGDLV